MKIFRTEENRVIVNMAVKDESRFLVIRALSMCQQFEIIGTGETSSWSAVQTVTTQKSRCGEKHIVCTKTMGMRQRPKTSKTTSKYFISTFKYLTQNGFRTRHVQSVKGSIHQ